MLADTIDSAGVSTAYKNLKYVERDFRITKADDLRPGRPIHHFILDNRVRAHVFLCMLAAYLTWHLRQAFAELTFTDQDIPANDDPVYPARRSAEARNKTAHGTPTSFPSANTVTSSTTFPRSTARPSISAASESRNSPAPRPPSAGRSNCSALRSR